LEELNYLEWWGIFSGLASVVGVIIAIIFHMKNKSKDQLAREFHISLVNQAKAIGEELDITKQYSEQGHAPMKARVTSILTQVGTLESSLESFVNGMWSRKN